VDALLYGTGGAGGWPQPGCRCASCRTAAAAGVSRQPGRVLVDGTLNFTAGSNDFPGTWPPATAAYALRRLTGGWDITGPDGGRLLLAAGPGDVPEPPPDASPYDLALLDLLASAAELGRLRAGGLVRDHTAVVALYTDHRIRSEAEMARRCALWRAVPGQDGQLVTSPAPGIPAVIPAPAAIRPHRTLIIGGGRSGKSTEAELRLAAEPAVTYLAAGPFAPARRGTGQHPAPAGDEAPGPPSDGGPDAEWAGRVARHQARRPAWWQTVEGLDLAGQLRCATGALLIDGVGTWLAGVMDETGLWTGVPAAEAAVADRIGELTDAWRQTSALVVAVTDQVGSGLVPANPAGRIFRDQLGWLNQRLAAESEVNLLVVAGQVTTLPG
jgi:adenosylcobinamide kinase/adenosylcobinamide-phosphate guanylyltransferase